MPLDTDLYGIVCTGLRNVAADTQHVSEIKERMLTLWQSASDEQKKAMSNDIMKAFERMTLSLESLKQEFTILSVQHR